MNKTEIETKAIAFFVVPNGHAQQLIEKESNKQPSPLLNSMRAAFGGNVTFITANSLERAYHYLFMVCFEDFPGAEKKVFDTLNDRFSDIAAGLNGGWSMEDAKKFMQEVVLEETGVVTCCIPMDRMDIIG